MSQSVVQAGRHMFLSSLHGYLQQSLEDDSLIEKDAGETIHCIQTAFPLTPSAVADQFVCLCQKKLT